MSQTPDMEAARLLQAVSPLPVPPFLLDEHVYDELAEAPANDFSVARPLPSWTFAKKRKSGNYLPQTIAHRGYKANFPENTMGAFRGAAEVGTHAIETDVQLSKDGVVVLSHDPTLKRCYGKDRKIIDLDWEDMKDLETLKAPHQTLPRLQDLLEMLASPGKEDIWLMLDIKINNDADDIMHSIAQTIHSVAPCSGRPWNQRIVLGFWASKYLPLCTRYLPDFPVTHIGFSTTYARQFLRVPNVSFNMHQQPLMVPYLGRHFLKDAQSKGRPVFTWTVNEEAKMRWSIREGLAGVVTDDPKRFLEVCEDWEQGHTHVHIPRSQWVMTAWLQICLWIFGAIFWWRHGGMGRPDHAGIQLREDQSEKSRIEDTKQRQAMKQ